jgi:hypothetical protein
MIAVAPIYPNRWTPMEQTCDGCGTKHRLDVEFIAGPFAAQDYQHCGKHKGEYVPGPIIAVWEQRNDEWALVSTRSL